MRLFPARPRISSRNWGYSVVTTPGHGATFRLMPEDAPVDDVAWGMEGMGGMFGGAEVQDYLREVQARRRSGSARCVPA